MIHSVVKMLGQNNYISILLLRIIMIHYSIISLYSDRKLYFVNFDLKYVLDLANVKSCEIMCDI